MPEAPERSGRSVRYRLLAIALLPTLVLLPVLLGITVARWNAKFDAALISKVNGDLTIAHRYLARILESTGEQLRALGASARFRDAVAAGDFTMYILVGMLVVGLICNALVRPLSDKWFMSDEEVAALQARSAAAQEGHTGSFGIGRGGLDANAALAWAAVGIPLLCGVWITLQKTAALF